MRQKSLLDHIKEKIEKGLDNSGFVVWYDDGGTLMSIIQDAVPQECNKVIYNGSILKIREIVERKDQRLQESWFIYIPMGKPEKSWIRDYECFGTCYELTLERMLNESYGMESTPELRQLLSGKTGQLITEHWGELTQDSSEKISQKKISDMILAIAFESYHSFDIREAILSYISDEKKHSATLKELGLHGKFNQKIRDYIGIDCLNQTEEVDVKILAAGLLISELVESSGGLFEKEFQKVVAIGKKRKNAADLVTYWTRQDPYKKAFFKWANIVSKQFAIGSKIQAIPEKGKLVKSLSFKEIDEVILHDLIHQIKTDGFNKRIETLKKVSEIRTELPWAKAGHSTYWRSINIACKLVDRVLASQKKLEEIDPSFDNYIQEFVKDDGWWIIDAQHMRLMAEQNYLPEISEFLIQPASSYYFDWLQKLGKFVSESVNQISRWESNIIHSQWDFWEITRRENEDCVAVLFIDALRFDLAQILISQLKDKDLAIETGPLLASIPSITEIGMVALLPKTKDQLSVSIVNDELSLMIDGNVIQTRDQRKKWISKQYPKGIFLSLKEIGSKSVPKIQEKVSKSSMVFIFDNEIDKTGTFTSPGISASAFNRLVELIAQAVINLHNAGVTKVIIGTDHGFLAIPEEFEKMSLVDSGRSNKGTIKSWRFMIGNPRRDPTLIMIDFENLGFQGKGVAAFPRGMHIFSMPGEEKPFLHGGVSLQECCIRYIISRKKEPTKPESVEIKCRIPNEINLQGFSVELIPQYDITKSGRNVKIQLYDEDRPLYTSKEIPIQIKTEKIPISIKSSIKHVRVEIFDTKTSEILFSEDFPVIQRGYDDFI